MGAVAVPSVCREPFPYSRRNPTAQRTGTYVACLDCGKEFRYDWHEMRIVGSQTREAKHSLVTKEAA